MPFSLPTTNRSGEFPLTKKSLCFALSLYNKRVFLELSLPYLNVFTLFSCQKVSVLNEATIFSGAFVQRRIKSFSTTGLILKEINVGIVLAHMDLCIFFCCIIHHVHTLKTIQYMVNLWAHTISDMNAFHRFWKAFSFQFFLIAGLKVEWYLSQIWPNYYISLILRGIIGKQGEMNAS